jgi:imidazolonepropionase-like amidohydrolase
VARDGRRRSISCVSVLFVNGLVIDGLGGFREAADVLVEGQRITAVGSNLASRRATDQRIVDLAGRALLPGMIDCHAHPGGGDYDPLHADESVGLAALRTLKALQTTLLAGVTTVRNAGVGHFVDVDARDAIDAGIAWGPRVLACGPIIRPTGGHATGEQLEVAAGPWSVREAVRTCLKRGVDAIKLLASGAVSQGGESVDAETFSREEMLAAVDEARRAGRPTLAHCIGNKGVKNAIAAGIDSVDHGIFLDEEDCAEMIRHVSGAELRSVLLLHRQADRRAVALRAGRPDHAASSPELSAGAAHGGQDRYGLRLRGAEPDEKRREPARVPAHGR